MVPPTLQLSTSIKWRTVAHASKRLPVLFYLSEIFTYALFLHNLFCLCRNKKCMEHWILPSSPLLEILLFYPSHCPHLPSCEEHFSHARLTAVASALRCMWRHGYWRDHFTPYTHLHTHFPHFRLTITVQSSEPLAMIWSLCGHQSMSKTGPVCPHTVG